MAQSTRWCFTLNNYSPQDVIFLTELGSEVKYLVFGREVAGTTGTPHLQGFVIFHTNKRLNAAKLAISNRAHLEIARGTSEQASTYCKKENDFEEFGSLPGPVGKTNRYDVFKEWVLAHPTKPSSLEVALEFPSIFMGNGRCMEFVDIIYPNVIPCPGEYNNRQQALADSLAVEADDRKITFIVDIVGNTGKSWFIKKFSSLNPGRVQVLSVGKRDDLAFAIDETKQFFFFDLPRSSAEFLQYTVLEQLKDRCVMSNKYQSRVKFIKNNPHVVVFMNERPDMSKLSSDRYNIINWVTLQN